MLHHAPTHPSHEQRDALRATARDLLAGADTLLTRCEREQRDPTPVEDARLASIMQRAARLNAKATEDDRPELPATPDRMVTFRAIAALVRAGGNVVTAERLARESMHDPEAALVLKAASAPANSTTAAWAGSLVATVRGDFIPLLRPRAALFELAADALLPFGGAQSIRYPRRATGSAGGFVAEGAAIPVRAWTLDSVTLTPYKLAGLTVATRELFDRADAFAESFVMGSLSDDMALGADQVFLGASASSSAAPAGLFHTDNAVAAISATAGANAAACATDLANLLAAGAAFTRPVLLINPATAAKALALSGASGYPIITALMGEAIGKVRILPAGNLTATTIALADADGLLFGAEDRFEMDISTNTTLHMDDAANSDLLVPTAGGLSLYQLDMVAVAVKMSITWRSKRTSAVQRIDNATWA